MRHWAAGQLGRGEAHHCTRGGGIEAMELPSAPRAAFVLRGTNSRSAQPQRPGCETEGNCGVDGKAPAIMFSSDDFPRDRYGKRD